MGSGGGEGVLCGLGVVTGSSFGYFDFLLFILFAGSSAFYFSIFKWKELFLLFISIKFSTLLLDVALLVDMGLCPLPFGRILVFKAGLVPYLSSGLVSLMFSSLNKTF